MKKLLGRKKTPEENPYAQQEAEQDAYNAMTPYQRAQSNIGQNRPGGLPSGPGRRDNNSPALSNQGYGSDRYGTGSGYGGDRYGGNAGAYASNQASPNVAPSTGGRSGGYGGFGPKDDAPSANDSNNLFGGAKSRAEPGKNPYANNPYANPSARPDPSLANNPYANPGASQGGNTPDYGGSDYANENLSPEELEEREVSQIKQQQKQARRDALGSVNRTLQHINQATETGTGTLARLGQQSERLHNAKNNLSIAENHTKVAQDKAKELKTLNRSMFAVHVSNPFTAKQRQRAEDEAILARDRQERDSRLSNRSDAYKANQQMEKNFQALEEFHQKQPPPRAGRSQADKSKYDFENDSEDEEMEEAIDRGQDEILLGAQKLHLIAKMQGEELERQNKFIDTIQTDAVHDGIVRTQATLNRIK